MTLGIIGAMDSETAALVAAMDETDRHTIAGTTFFRGRIAEQSVVVVRCGIGKVCAALCAQILIDRFGVDGIVNTGIAGGLGRALAIGDFVVADAAVQHDFDLTAFGHVRGFMPAMGGDDTAPSRYPTDPALSAAFRRAAEQVRTAKGGFACHGGTVVSGDVFVDSTPLKQTLIRDFNAVAAEMEGAAIAQVAYLNGVPFALIRAISDLAEGGAAANFEIFEQETAALGARILLTMLAQM